MSATWLLIAQAAVFITVALLVWAAATAVLSVTTSDRRRLFAVTRPAKAAPPPEIIQLSIDTEETGLQKLAVLLPRSRKEMERLRVRLARAGFKHPAAPVTYSLIEYIGPVVVGGLIVLALGTSPRVLGVAGLAAFLTFFAPGFRLEQILSNRRRDIDHGLPDALDLLVVCIEAGSGIDQAIMKTAEEISLAYPALGDELRVLTMEIRAGKTRLEAFKNFAQRTKSDDVRALVAMLIQTDRFGTSVGQALRTHAEVSRTKRRQAAEEAAQKIGVKLVFPLVFCFFPAFYVVVLGPAVIQFIRAFMSK